MLSTIRDRLEGAWLDLPLQLKTAAIAAIPLACLCFGIVWVGALEQTQQSVARLTLHSQAVEIAGQRLLSLLVDEETGVRGYLVTGAPEFLQPYQRAATEIPGIEETLRALVVDNPAQEARLRDIALLAQEKHVSSQQMIAAKSSPAPAVTEQQMAAGKRLMDALRVKIAEFVEEEQSLFGAREEQLRRQWRQTNYALWGSGVFGLFGALASALVIGRGLTGRFRRIAQEAAALSAPGAPPPGREPLLSLEAQSLEVQSEDAQSLAAQSLAAQSKELQSKDELGVLARELHAAHQLARRRREQLEARERELRERNASLAELNRELEAFSYSVSHDLRAPLRHVDGYGKLLLEDYRAEIPTEAAEMLQRICAATERMGLLIDELLNLGRLSRRQLHAHSFSLRELVVEAREALARETGGRQVEWRIGALPEAVGDVTLIRQVIYNLLANAVKYTRKRERAVIEVGYEAADCRVFVRDNGAGFDMRYAEKLFGVFQRLHREDEFEGTGVGLACAARIVHRHGGRIWAEAAPDRGATFYFTLPGMRATAQNALLTAAAEVPA